MVQLARGRMPSSTRHADPFPSPADYQPQQLAQLWPAWASCADIAPKTFYSTRPADRARAAAACQHCCVLDVCLWSALVEEEPSGYHYGFRGGLTPAARALIQSVIGSGEACVRLLHALRALSQSHRSQQQVADAFRRAAA